LPPPAPPAPVDEALLEALEDALLDALEDALLDAELEALLEAELAALLDATVEVDVLVLVAGMPPQPSTFTQSAQVQSSAWAKSQVPSSTQLCVQSAVRSQSEQPQPSGGFPWRSQKPSGVPLQLPPPRPEPLVDVAKSFVDDA
jgi:hypothetical protein